MTRNKFLAIVAGRESKKGYRAHYVKQPAKYCVYLEPNSVANEPLYSTTNLAKAVDAENRFNMWLFQAGLHQDCRPAGGAK